MFFYANIYKCKIDGGDVFGISKAFLLSPKRVMRRVPG